MTPDPNKHCNIDTSSQDPSPHHHRQRRHRRAKEDRNRRDIQSHRFTTSTFERGTLMTEKEQDIGSCSVSTDPIVKLQQLVEGDPNNSQTPYLRSSSNDRSVEGDGSAKNDEQEEEDFDAHETIEIKKSATVPLNRHHDPGKSNKPGKEDLLTIEPKPAAAAAAAASTYKSGRDSEKVENFNEASKAVSPRGLPRVIHTSPSTPIAPSTSFHPVSANSITGSISGGEGGGGGSSNKIKTSLRRGKWTSEEEAYVARIIQDFNSGFLNAPAGTTLRSYLSEKLQCDPMRITKKFTGDSCIGKRVFHPAVRSASNGSAIDKAQAELDALERRWRRRLEMQQRESAKKAAASAAAHASSFGRPNHIAPSGPLHANADGVGNQQAKQQVVTQTASWLDRANAILQANIDAAASGDAASEKVGSFNQPPSSASNGDSLAESVASSDIENQMKEVQRLIYEGPYIQQTSAGLPQLLDRGGTAGNALVPTAGAAVTERIAATTATASHGLTGNSENGTSPPESPIAEPLDKRMRPTPEAGAEDAEALVGFLRSVRASAAASGHSGAN